MLGSIGYWYVGRWIIRICKMMSRSPYKSSLFALCLWAVHWWQFSQKRNNLKCNCLKMFNVEIKQASDRTPKRLKTWLWSARSLRCLSSSLNLRLSISTVFGQTTRPPRLYTEIWRKWSQYRISRDAIKLSEATTRLRSRERVGGGFRRTDLFSEPWGRFMSLWPCGSWW